MAENVKTVQGLAIASVSTIQGLAIASAKTVLGVDNTGGGFTPPDAGTILVWHDASSLGLADGDPISTWTDLSGNDNHLAQTSTARPTFETGVQNSLSVARFDGSNDFMDWTVFGLSPTNVTIFIVMAPTGTVDTSSDYGLFSRATGVQPFGLVYMGDFSSQFTGEVMTFASSGVSGVSFPTGAAITSSFSGWNAWCFRLNGTTETIFKNGASQSLNISSSGHMDSGAANRFTNVDRLGTFVAGSFFAGDMGEIIIYDEALDDTEAGLVNTYLKDKWGTP